jgi:hypothetical protein
LIIFLWRFGREVVEVLWADYFLVKIWEQSCGGFVSWFFSCEDLGEKLWRFCELIIFLWRFGREVVEVLWAHYFCVKIWGEVVEVLRAYYFLVKI